MTRISDCGGSIATELQALQWEERVSDIHGARNEAKVSTDEKHEHVVAQREAEQKAAEEAHHSSFWGDVAEVAKYTAVGASVAAAAFTGGSSLVVAATLVGAGLTVGGGVAKKLGASDGVCTAMEVGGAGCMVVAGGAGLFASPAMSSGAAAAGGLASRGVGAGATGTAAYAEYRKGAAKSRETGDDADATEARHAFEDAGLRADAAITRAERSLQSSAAKSKLIGNLQAAERSEMDAVVRGMRA